MEIHIRPYTESDYQFTYDLHRRNMLPYVEKYWGRWNPEIFKRGVRTEITWIIEYDDTKVGYFVLNFDAQALLGNIQIDSRFQNLGIGSQVLTHCEVESKNNGFDILYLQVFCDNPARQLYDRFGYVVYEVTETHYLMKKQLFHK